uniref:DNA-binding protein n=1 Tax=Telmatospirillum sp. J64-1 TaxID=2502183 RepID=UPI001C8F1FEC
MTEAWYSATALVEAARAGILDLPTSKSGLTRKAARDGWKVREVKGDGGLQYHYHVSSLPPKARRALERKLLADAAEQAPAVPAPVVAPSQLLAYQR